MSTTPANDRADPLDFAAISTHSSDLRDTNRLVLRYSDAIRKYAAAQLRDAEQADDVHLLVVQNMLEGRFTRATVAKGRFRYYVQRSVRHAVLTYQRRQSRQRGLLQRIGQALGLNRDGEAGRSEPPADAALLECELRIWREAVLSRTLEGALKALAEFEKDHQERTHPNVYHTLARLLIELPGLNSEELAVRLSAQVERSFTASCTRSLVMRMRKKFAELLVSEIAQQVDEPTVDNVSEELAELGLLMHVKPYLPTTDDSSALNQ